jgi:hypothetical protein
MAVPSRNNPHEEPAVDASCTTRTPRRPAGRIHNLCRGGLPTELPLLAGGVPDPVASAHLNTSGRLTQSRMWLRCRCASTSLHSHFACPNPLSAACSTLAMSFEGAR